MKTLAITFLFVISGLSLLAQEKVSDASFEETVDWINSKLNYSNLKKTYADGTGDEQRTVHCKLTTINENNEIIHVFITDGKQTFSDGSTYILERKDEYKVNLNNLVELELESGKDIKLNFIDNSVELKYNGKVREGGGISALAEVSDVEKVSELRLSFKSEEITERMYKAFSHLTYLNTKKMPKEEF